MKIKTNGAGNRAAKTINAHHVIAIMVDCALDVMLDFLARVMTGDAPKGLGPRARKVSVR
jgi:hypothetical protein